jgi:cell division protein FtsI (penicillin-binding protein 3)
MVERRLTWLAAIVLLWGAAIFGKLVSLQVLRHQEYLNLAKARQELVIEIPGPRGTVFDRWGQPLAMSVQTESVYINPLKVPDLGVASELLGLVLHMDRQSLYDKMQQAFDAGRGFLWVKRKIAPEEAESLRTLRLEWIKIQTESQRHYPKGTLAAHVLGAVNFEERGTAGVEKALDSDLRGQPGREHVLTDVKRRGIDSRLSTEAKAGTSITLTIDERLQYVAEREVAAAVAVHHALSGSVVMMNPYNGEVLAMASYPAYDPNVIPEHGENLAKYQNHAVSVPFEPGSVYKVITLSAALETTTLRPDSLINCHGGVLKLPGRVIHDSHGGIGVVPMETVLAKSSNIGAIMVGMRVGEENMYQYMQKFGFGRRTGIELPAESPGKVYKLSRWGKTSLASVSMGQEVSVTTLQLAQAASVVANGGMLVKPRLILKKGNQVMRQAVPVRVLKPETAITMRQMMEGVVLHGTGTRARLAGYTVGGKTGSAQIYDFAAKHYTHSYNGSFMGFAPITNPQIVVVVTLNGTHGEGGFGGAAAAPAFKVVAGEALRVLDVPKDVPEIEPTKTLVTKAGQLDDLADADSRPGQPNILADGDAGDAEDAAAAAVGAAAANSSTNNPATTSPAGPAVPAAPAAPAVPDGPRVPNFAGKSMRVVLAEAAAQGLTVLPDGSGIARVQFPAPGSPLHEGDRIRVQFRR